MSKKKMTIEVPEEIAQAYRKASPEKRQRAGRAMAYSLMSRKKAAKQLREILDRMGQTAEERGLTEDKLQELLSDG